MRRASDAGIPVIVVTGRMVHSVRQALEPAGIEAPVICYQGAVVADEHGRWLRHEPLPLELAREAIAALAEEGYSPNVYVDDELYVASDTPEARAYGDLNRIRFHVVGDLLDWLDAPPTKLVCVGDPSALDALEPRMKALFGDRAFIAKSLPHFLEFAQAGVTKGAGMDFLAQHLGFTKDADDRVRRRGERSGARRLARLRDRRRERAAAREGARRLDLPLRGGRRRRAGDRRASRLAGMIDLRAARNDPEAFRAALARKGAAEAFDELLEVDAGKRKLQTKVEELRAQTKVKGKPTPEQLGRAAGGEGAAPVARGRVRRRRSAAAGAVGSGFRTRPPTTRRTASSKRTPSRCARSVSGHRSHSSHATISSCRPLTAGSTSSAGAKSPARGSSSASATWRCSSCRCSAGRSTGS